MNAAQEQLAQVLVVARVELAAVETYEPARRASLQGLRPFVLLAVCGAACAVAYGVATLLLGVPTPEERGLVRRQLARARALFPTWRGGMAAG